VWQPERTWVVVVGALDFRDRESFHPFPTIRRRDAALVRVLERRGVPREQIAYLRDSAVTVRGVQSAIARTAASAGPGDWLFVYYTGHGWKDDETGGTYFATYDAVDPVKGVDVRTVVSLVARNFGGERAFLFADCCDSGALTNAVRASRPGFGFAALCSSQAVEESTGDWTFSDCLLDALDGDPYLDLDGDGTITLGELASGSADEMAVGEEQLVSFVTTEGFGAETALADVRLQRAGRIGERGEVDADDGPCRVRVIAERGDELKVHEIGDDDNDDVWIDAYELRPYRPRRYAVGTPVEAESQGDWYAARVVDVRRGVHRVHFDGYSDDEDEWVPSARVRLAHGRRR
jgi:hypothetical protein